MKTKIISVLSFVICAIVVVLCVVIINSTKIPTNPNHEQSTEDGASGNITQGEDLSISLTCQDIEMYIDDQFSTIIFSTNLKENYTISYDYDKTKLSIIDNKIYPLVSGEYNVVMTISTTAQKTASDNFTVTVFETVTDASAKVFKDETTVDALFCNESYNIVFSINATMHTNFNIDKSENISNLTIVPSDDKQKIIFSFNVTKCENTEFIFSYRSFTKTFTFPVYNYINNFDVNFSNSFSGDVLTLYLFDSDHSTDANLDEKFNSATFEISTNEDAMQKFDATIINTDIAQIVDNKIVALKEGQTSFVINAQDGSNFSKSITVSVQTIKVQNITTSVEEVQLKVGESFEIEYSYSPVYAICDFEVVSNGLTIENNIIIANSTGSYEITIYDNLSNKSAKIYVTVIEDDANKTHFKVEFNQSFIDTYNATFLDNTLTVDTDGKEIQIPFSFAIIYGDGDSYEGEITTDISISIDNFSDITFKPIIEVNTCTLVVSGTGKINITLTLLVNGEKTDITHNITIIIE